MENLMRYVSLFSGIGGLDLGLDRAGWTCVVQVERDPYCLAVLRKHWPHVPKHEDVRTFSGHGIVADAVVGGFPCQDISNAGTTHEGGLLGLEGARSGLWSEFIRVVRELLPRWVLVENVGALAVRGLAKVLYDLAQSGFDADWATIPASALGAPHHRDRLFIVARRVVRYAHELPACPNCGDLFCPECGQHCVGCAHPGPDSWPELLQNPNGTGLEGHVRSILAVPDDWRQHADAARSTRWGDPPPVRTVADGLPANLAGRRPCLTAIGNAVVPHVAEWIARRINAFQP